MKSLVIIACLASCVVAWPTSNEEKKESHGAHKKDHDHPDHESHGHSIYVAVARQRPGTHLDHLMEDLFTRKYHRSVRPCATKACTDAVRVSAGMSMINFDLDLEGQELRSHGWMRMMWKDERLKWDPSDYGGIGEIRVPQDRIWIPDLFLYNRFAHVRQEEFWSEKVLALVYSSGDVMFIPPAVFSSYCAFNSTQDNTWEDRQTCNLKFGSWTYSKKDIDLVKTDDSIKTCDISSYKGTVQKGWIFKSCSAEVIDKKYACCEETYPSLNIALTFNKGTKEEEKSNVEAAKTASKNENAEEEESDAEGTFWF